MFCNIYCCDKKCEWCSQDCSLVHQHKGSCACDDHGACASGDHYHTLNNSQHVCSVAGCDSNSLRDENFCDYHSQFPLNGEFTDLQSKIVESPPISYVKVDSDYRQTWSETWMDFAKIISARSHDSRLKVGAIIVAHDNTCVFSEGYNGNYAGGEHKPESLEPGQSMLIHAEVNALIKCDFNAVKKKVLYVTHSPCKMCAKLIVNAGIVRVVYDTQYRDTSGLDILTKCGIEVQTLAQAAAIERRKNS